MNSLPVKRMALGIGLLLLINAIVLAGVYYNRAVDDPAVIHLTERELPMRYLHGLSRENSGITLGLRWRVTDRYTRTYISATPDWLDTDKLRQLGFESDELTPASTNRRYRTTNRQVLLVLEYDGPAYRQALADVRKRLAQAEQELAADPDNKALQSKFKSAEAEIKAERNSQSRLFVVDAGLDPDALRQQYPDAMRYLIMAGKVSAVVRSDKNDNTRVNGYVRGPLVNTIHVPLQFHDELMSALPESQQRKNMQYPRYQVDIVIGNRLEPWITACNPIVKQSR